MSAQHTPGLDCEECEGPCLQSTPQVLTLLASVDDHLQAMMHYGHSREQRVAMSVVQDLLDALVELRDVARCLQPTCLADERAKERRIERADAAIARATGSAT